MVVGVGGFGQSCLLSDCKSCSGEEGRVSKGDIFNLAGLSDDHLLSPILLYKYDHQQTLLPSFIPNTCGTAPLQLCNMMELWKTAMISRQMLTDKRYFCLINNH